ncbi:MAG: GNAT family N-acetyltransferase [Pseudomonadota bacterium]
MTLAANHTGHPAIETERLRLRAFRPGDDAAMIAFYASESSAFYGGPCEANDAWRKAAVYPGHWALRGYGPFALEERASGRFVGLCGPWFPLGFPEPEITWMLVEDARGQGFAVEAARAALAFAYATLGWVRAVSCINPDNTPSLRLAERLGAVHEYDTAVGSTPVGVWRHAVPAALETSP